MRTLLLMLGIPDMPIWQLVIFLALVAVATLLLGWIADLTIGEGGYGVMINGALMLVGAIGGVLLWRKLGYRVNLHPQAASAMAGAVSGSVLLLFCVITRRWL